MPVAEIGGDRINQLVDDLISGLHNVSRSLIKNPLDNEDKVDEVTEAAIGVAAAQLMKAAAAGPSSKQSEPLHVFRVEASFIVKAAFDVIAFDEDEASDLAAGSPTVLHAKAVGYGLDSGCFDVDPDSVQVEDLGEASEADGNRPEQVLAIRP